MNTLPVLSYIQAVELLNARMDGRSTAVISTDLNLSRTEVTVHPDRVSFPDGRSLPWSAVQEIADTRNACFAVCEDRLKRIQSFSQVTNRYCSLMPTRSAPTLLIAGFPMHRIKDTDPYHDTLSKIRTLRPVVGQVLDTSMGLGYTAIEAARTAEHVTTIELDPAVVEIARQNPWSQALFNNPRISVMIGDSRCVIRDLKDGSFSRIVHDPPNFSLAGELYSGAFYRELFRLLSRTGRLFHYVGDLQSGSGGRIVRGVVRRLQQAGFRQVRPEPRAFGLLAQK
jgi:predicted methyltransferase